MRETMIHCSKINTDILQKVGKVTLLGGINEEIETPLYWLDNNYYEDCCTSKWFHLKNSFYFKGEGAIFGNSFKNIKFFIKTYKHEYFQIISIEFKEKIYKNKGLK
jgi:hypothetical protein